jgi:hypothetical protein
MRDVWFGTKGNMKWVPAPAIDVQAGRVGWAQQANFMGGGAWVRRSKAAAKKFVFSWNLKSRAEIQPIIDFADGLYGNGYIYYSNPFAMDRNVLPSYWAAPYMNYYDGPVVVDETRPTVTSTTTSVNGYPLESAIYTITSTSNVPSVFIPIPPGYTAYVGAHGTLNSGSASVRVIPEISPIASGSPTDLTLLSTTTSTRTNSQFSGNSYIGITITMRSASTGVLQLSGLIVQVLPDGAVVESGGFISGQGQSGMSFVSEPVISEYSAAMDRVGVSAELIETEAWAWQ